MPHDRFFIDHPLKINENVEIKDELSHLKVMRKKEGDLIELINGKNQLALARIIQLGTKSALIQIENISIGKMSKYKTILAQPYLRSNKLDLIIEKAAELDIDEIYLFHAQRGDAIHEKEKRELSIIIAALKQCGRLNFLKLHHLKDLFLMKEFDFDFFFGDMNSTQMLDIFHLKKNYEKPICFINGPEKGFSEKEKTFMNSLKAIPINLAPNILRAETASICAASLLSQIKL